MANSSIREKQEEVWADLKAFLGKEDEMAETRFEEFFYRYPLMTTKKIIGTGLLEYHKSHEKGLRSIVRLLLVVVENIPGAIRLIEKDEQVMRCLSSLHTFALRNQTNQYCQRFHSWFGEVIASTKLSLNQLDFWITEMRRVPCFDFTDSTDPRHDITLVVEGKKLHVSKQILSLHSPVFNAMFYGDFAERDKEEIELKDVAYEDFIEMLNLIYPSAMIITDEYVEGLLAVGDRFQIKMIIDQVEQFLISSNKFSVAAKLKISGEYRLIGLQAFCLDSLKTTSDVADLEKMDEYHLLSDAIKAAILDKVMKIIAA